MTTLSKIKRKEPKIITFGALGTGKTLFWETGGENVHIIDCDDGTQSGLNWKDKFQEARGQCDVKRFLDPDPDRVSAFIRIRSHIIDVARRCKQGTWPWPIVVIDSLTSLGEMALRQVMFNAGKIKGGKIEQTEIQHWGTAFNEIKNLLTHVRSMNVCVVLIAHDDVREVGARKEIILACAGKKLPNEIPRLFDEVWYHQKEDLTNGKLRINVITKPTSALNARSRANISGKFNVNKGCLAVLEEMGYDAQAIKEEWKQKKRKKLEAKKSKEEASETSTKKETKEAK